ncbi:MAG: DUF1015 domain-containing protein [Spirochaetota bacterium]
MITIKPFRGLRPKKELAEKVASPPYDVINSEEARKLAEGDKYTFLHVVKPEIDLDKDISLYDDRVYNKGKENLDNMIKEGILFQDDKPCFYIYRQKMKEHTQYGLVAGASVEDYDADRIKKHEYTRKKKEEDRTKHIETLNANTGPVFLTYKNNLIDELVEKITKNEPEYDFTSPDGIKHTLWIVDDDYDIKEIQTKFKNMDYLYVADGHHRSASASNVAKKRKESNPKHTGDEEYNYFLSVIFPSDQMYIMDYNRVVADLNGNSEEQFMEKLKKDFEIEKTTEKKPKAKHEFGMYLDGQWYRLKAKKGSFDESGPVKSLDVSILQENVLTKLLNITDPRTDDRIDFVGGIRGVEELEKRVNDGKYKLAFSMYPTSIDELMSVADSGNVMPPKSTWFEPKLRSGLITHLLD